MSIVAAKDVHVIFIDDGRVRMTWAWSSFWVEWFHQIPSAALNTEAMKIIDSIVSIIATEDVNTSIVDDCSMSISWGRRLCISVRGKLTPGISLEVKAIKIVTPVCSIVPTENVEVVLEGNRSM